MRALAVLIGIVAILVLIGAPWYIDVITVLAWSVGYLLAALYQIGGSR